MSQFWKKTTRHLVIVGISLAIVGHLLGRAFLLAHETFAGGAYNPENERVLWQTPLVMALLGMGMTLITDLVFGRRQQAKVAVSHQSPNQTGS